jgi:hypothetical protein
MDCGKTYIGPQAPGMTCNCMPPKLMIGTPVASVARPLSQELQQLYTIGNATQLRAQLCQRWGIVNKSHAQHGSNFSGNQTLAQLIQNIVSPIQAPVERSRVKALIIREYGYDIDTQAMD